MSVERQSRLNIAMSDLLETYAVSEILEALALQANFLAAEAVHYEHPAYVIRSRQQLHRALLVWTDQVRSLHC